MAVIYLTLEHVVAIHDAALEEHGGKAGFHAQELVESAVEMPKSSFGGSDLYPDLLDKASAYLFFIASNHGFADGNKRAALAAALTFLSLNGQDVEIPVERWNEAEALTLAIADGKMKREEATARFREFLASIGAKGA
jgi:death-on-curing protein